ncbi:YicC/YloC family endoribonuclease [Microbulbifer harenosus]|uniref:YicC family protein n=1 Tax=Microbulbifer harenosus TaxID=2576840 RepID=A0ABY2UKV2_9GAMM|nr:MULTISPECIES: YicC/YloC family endoribonuclease [Microbulbifer]QIL90814.1 YicC family protein [Microbulbifer sp. SH-1]TLM79034.1 YicC family protein [Microbulbifer harenosus]
MANDKVRSMTAFGRAEVNYSTGTAVWEMRSVNHRYLEPHFRLPEAARALEPKLRELLRKNLNRGKVEMTLNLKANSGEVTGLQINQALVEELVRAAMQVTPESQPLNPLEVLKWPGVIAEPETDTAEQARAILDGFQQALTQVVDNREREGAELAGFIEARIKGIGEQVAKVRALLPQILQNQREKLKTRLQELLEEIDKDRIEQEIALLAQKADVDEELDRLDAHITETRRVLKNGGPIGRRLDFLMQEFNREANTLSSKAVVTDTTQAAVELKVLIEQMREQVQNIE